MTLVVPLINAAHRNNPAQFVEHGVFVVGVSGLVLGLVLLVRKGFNKIFPEKRQLLKDFYETKNFDCGR